MIDTTGMPCSARALLCAAALVALAPTRAQARPDPADAAAPVPALVYASPLASFRALADEAPVPWRQANDTAARIGGWRAYAREAGAPAQPASSAAPGAAAPAGHAAHDTKRGRP